MDVVRIHFGIPSPPLLLSSPSALSSATCSFAVTIIDSRVLPAGGKNLLKQGMMNTFVFNFPSEAI